MGNGKDRLKDREFIGPLFQSKFQFLFVVVRGSKYGKLQCPLAGFLCKINLKYCWMFKLLESVTALLFLTDLDVHFITLPM